MGMPKDRRDGSKKTPVLFRVLCWSFILLGLCLVTVSTIMVPMLRPLPESVGRRLAPIVMAIVGEKISTNPLRRNPPALPVRADQSSTSALTRQSGATVPAPYPQPYELIPEMEFKNPEKKTEIRRFNESFRQWAELWTLYQLDRARFDAIPQAQQKLDKVDYALLRTQLAQIDPSPVHQKKLSDAVLQVLSYCGNWNEAGHLCFRNSHFYSWDETLSYLRHERRPLVRIPNIIMLSSIRLLGKQREWGKHAN